MKKTLHTLKSLAAILGVCGLSTVSAQITFDPTIDADMEMHMLNSEIIVPASPLETEVIFIGGVDMVQTTATYGNAAGTAVNRRALHP